jgi:hypothetical protein
MTVDVLYVEIEVEIAWIACIKTLEVSDTDMAISGRRCGCFHIEIELEMMRITCIKRMEVNGMTWLLMEDDVDVLHVVEIE